MAQPFSATCYPGNGPAVRSQDVRDGFGAGWAAALEPLSPAGLHTGQLRKWPCWKNPGHRNGCSRRECGALERRRPGCPGFESSPATCQPSPPTGVTRADTQTPCEPDWCWQTNRWAHIFKSVRALLTERREPPGSTTPAMYTF